MESAPGTKGVLSARLETKRRAGHGEINAWSRSLNAFAMRPQTGTANDDWRAASRCVWREPRTAKNSSRQANRAASDWSDVRGVRLGIGFERIGWFGSFRPGVAVAVQTTAP